MSSALVVAVGNEIVGNDGIGLHILNELQQYSLPSYIKTIYLGTDCWALPKEAAEYANIILVDGIDIGAIEGELYYIPAVEIPSYKQPYSLHDITCLEILRMGGLLNKTYIFGVQTGTLNYSTEPSPILKEKIKKYAAQLYDLVTN